MNGPDHYRQAERLLEERSRCVTSAVNRHRSVSLACAYSGVSCVLPTPRILVTCFNTIRQQSRAVQDLVSLKYCVDLAEGR
jgi:hypothetical protein